MKLLDVMTRIVFAGTVACAMAVAAPVSAGAEELPWKWDDTNHPADVKTSAAGTIEGSLDAAWRISAASFGFDVNAVFRTREVSPAIAIDARKRQATLIILR